MKPDKKRPRMRGMESKSRAVLEAAKKNEFGLLKVLWSSHILSPLKGFILVLTRCCDHH